VIDSYRFGRIVIQRIPYTHDIILFPDHVQADWRREEGHHLKLKDISASLEEVAPVSLVVGTGAFGAMQIGDDIKPYLDRQDIRLYAERTDKAVKIYNRLLLSDNQILGAFHLTC